MNRVFPYEAKATDPFDKTVKDDKLLSAARLVKYSHLGFKATDNLAEHLSYDSGSNIVSIFLHTGFLHALLNENPQDLSLQQSLQECVTCNVPC
jgi:hypothetical protein